MVRTHQRARDEGFTLVEVLVSVAVIATIMAALTFYFVRAVRVTHGQGIKQVAVQLALDGVEQARGFRGAALLTGRARCGGCPVPVPGAAAYLTGTERWDLPVGALAAASLPRPTDAATEPLNTVTLDQITYRQYWYVGKCWAPAGGGGCGLTISNPAPMYRVVVAVTWAGQECAGQVCSHVTSALFSANTTEPLFGL